MATSGSFNVSTNNSYIGGTVTWSESSVSDTANTSVVTATMKLSRTNSGYTSYGTDTFYVTINGTKTSATKDYTLTYNSNTTMVSGSQTVTHNSDGSKSITISWGGGGGSGGVFTVNSGSGTATLTTIPRGSTITSDVSWTAGTGSLAVTLQTYSSSYTNDLLVEVEDLNNNWQSVATRTGVSSSTTITFTESENTVVFNANGGHEDRPARVTVTTKSGSTVVGTDTQTGTVWIPTTSKATLNGNNTFNIGDSIPFTIAPYYSQTGFTYDVVMTFGGWTKTWSGFTGNSTLTFTTTDITNMYAQIPTANSGTGNIRLRTYYNGVSTEDGASANYPSGGEDQTNFTCYVKSGSSNPIFGATYTYQDTKSATYTLTGSNQYIVQGQSTVQLNFDTTDVATGKNSASVVYYMATLGSNSCKMYVPYTKPTVSVASNSGSTLAAATYYVKYTWEHTTGYESLPSPEASIAVATGQNLVITVPSLPSGVKSVNIYMSTSAGTEKLQANITGTSYTRSTAYNASGSVLPTMMYFSLGTTSASSNTTASIQAVDTRNNSYTTSIPITVVPYQMPVATAKAIRQDGFNTATDFTISGTYSLLNINSSIKNALSVVSVKYKKTTDSTYTTPTPNLAWTIPTTPNGTYSAPTLTEQLDNTASWNVVFTITDKLTTNTVPITVGQGNPIVFVDVDKGSVGVGMFPANNDSLDVGGGITATGNMTANGILSGGGTDFKLGTYDTSRGSVGAGRALVKGNPSGTNNAPLIVNYGGDFAGGTEVQGPSLKVDGTFDAEGAVTLNDQVTVDGGSGSDQGILLNNGWFRSVGSTGWYNKTYTGGWYMIDTTWVRSYQSKSVYTGGQMKADGGLVGHGYNVFENWAGGGYKVQMGSYNFGALTAGSQTSHAITFPHAFGSGVTPMVFCFTDHIDHPAGYNTVQTAESETSTGFTIYATTYSSTTTDFVVNWLAFGN